MLHPIKLIARLIKKVIYRNPKIRDFLARHPRFFLFVRKRFTPDEKFGLYLTIGGFLTIFFIFLFFGFVEDLIGRDPLNQTNLRIINLVQFFRIPLFSNVMLFFTYLGKWQIVFLGVLALSMVFVIFRRWYYLTTLMISVGGAEIFVWIMNRMNHRPGLPFLGVLAPEEKFDFPSVHSFVAFSFYGLATYFLFRTIRGGLWKTFSLIIGTIVISAIGFSRIIYPESLWPTDVFASYASGAAWLTTLVTASEIRRRFNAPKFEKPYLKKSVIEIMGIVLFLIWSSYVIYSFQIHALNPKLHEYKHQFAILEDAFDKNLFSAFPSVSDDIIGAPVKPINIIIVGGQEKLNQAFANTNWVLSDPLTLKNLWRLISSSISKRPYPKAPSIPSFWNGWPSDFSYVQPTLDNPLIERHHINFWKTPFVLDGNSPVWFGSAHFDRAVTLKSGRTLPVHNIDPTVDNERDKIRDDLLKTGIIENVNESGIVGTTKNNDRIANQFFTDGKVYILYLED